MTSVRVHCKDCGKEHVVSPFPDKEISKSDISSIMWHIEDEVSTTCSCKDPLVDNDIVAVKAAKFSFGKYAFVATLRNGGSKAVWIQSSRELIIKAGVIKLPSLTKINAFFRTQEGLEWAKYHISKQELIDKRDDLKKEIGARLSSMEIKELEETLVYLNKFNKGEEL